MQIDPAVEHVDLGVESYPVFSSWNWTVPEHIQSICFQVARAD